MIRTNLVDAAVLQRARRPLWLLAARRSWSSRRRCSTSSRVLRYSRSDTELATRRRSDEARAAELRRSRPRGCAPASIREQVDAASADARQANDLIDRRTFSWTELFNRFETTLPDDVRITRCGRSRRPGPRHRADHLDVVAQASTTSNQFIENLEATGAFTELRPVEEQLEREGQIEMRSKSVLTATGSASAAGADGGANDAARSDAILAEKRAIVVAAACAWLVVNVARLFLVVRPLA